MFKSYEPLDVSSRTFQSLKTLDSGREWPREGAEGASEQREVAALHNCFPPFMYSKAKTTTTINKTKQKNINNTGPQHAAPTKAAVIRHFRFSHLLLKVKEVVSRVRISPTKNLVRYVFLGAKCPIIRLKRNKNEGPQERSLPGVNSIYPSFFFYILLS